MFEIAENLSKLPTAKIIVMGVGGAGCNAVNTMISSGLGGVSYIVANTDVQALSASLSEVKVQLGKEITKGLGAGANPEVGRKAALEDYEAMSALLQDADMVFITAGMGGGTGTGAAPIIAKLCRELGILTVGVVTKPFAFEGKKRMRQALEGFKELGENVDSLISIPNDKLLELAGEELSLVDTFKKADEILLNAVKGISDLVNNTGLINSDFSDVRSVMKDKGIALMGSGICIGETRAIDAAKLAIHSPLLEDVSIDGAKGLIVNISGGSNLTTSEANQAMSYIMQSADEEAEIIFGMVIADEPSEEVQVTVIATGLNEAMDRTGSTKEVLNRENLSGAFESIREHEKNNAEVIAQQEKPTITTRLESLKNINNPNIESSSKAKTRSIAEKLGFMNFDEDEFDTPSFMRKNS